MSRGKSNAGISFKTSSKTPWFLFDTDETLETGGALLLENADRILRADEIEQVPIIIEQLQQALDEGLYAAGFFSYELGYALEPTLHSLMPENRQMPLIWFALFPEAQQLQGAKLQETIAQNICRKPRDDPQKYNSFPLKARLFRPLCTG